MLEAWRAAQSRRLLWPVALAFAWSCSPTTTISWTDTSVNERGFRIYRTTDHGTKLVGEVGPGITRFTDSHAPRLSCYRVIAFGTRGESLPSPMVCAPM